VTNGQVSGGVGLFDSLQITLHVFPTEKNHLREFRIKSVFFFSRMKDY
jgi:hypothetical protein